MSHVAAAPIAASMMNNTTFGDWSNKEPVSPAVGGVALPVDAQTSVALPVVAAGELPTACFGVGDDLRHENSQWIFHTLIVAKTMPVCHIQKRK